MEELPTATEMGALESAAIAGGAVTGKGMMESAGRGAVDALLSRWPDLGHGPRSAAVLCGPGNNGGDGFVVARHLHARGWDVRVYLYGRAPADLDRLPADAAANARAWSDLGSIREAAAFDPAGADLIVDALFGTGLARPLKADLLGIVDTANAPRPLRRLAIDMPSGLCSDSGRVLGDAVIRADLTATFHAAKPGHYLAQGPDTCGAVARIDIGLAPGEPRAHRVTGPTIELSKRTPAHKYDHGHALVLSGGVGRGGAGRLAARGALRIGAGLVTVGCPPAAVIENAAQLNAIMLRPVADAEGLSEHLADPRLNAICLGPGLGVTAETRARVAAACVVARGTVLDADALTAFADAPDDLWALTHPGCVLTPHPGEFARVFPDIVEKLSAPAESGPAFSRIDAVRAAAIRAGCTVLLKGPDTVIAGPDGTVRVVAAVYEDSAPWLATAGAGDVLSGLIAGLLARGAPPLDAAATGAWVHAAAARAFGPGLIAEDIPETVPRILGDLA